MIIAERSKTVASYDAHLLVTALDLILLGGGLIMPAFH